MKRIIFLIILSFGFVNGSEQLGGIAKDAATSSSSSCRQPDLRVAQYEVRRSRARIKYQERRSDVRKSDVWLLSTSYRCAIEEMEKVLDLTCREIKRDGELDQKLEAEPRNCELNSRKYRLLTEQYEEHFPLPRPMTFMQALEKAEQNKAGEYINLAILEGGKYADLRDYSIFIDGTREEIAESIAQMSRRYPGLSRVFFNDEGQDGIKNVDEFPDGNEQCPGIWKVRMLDSQAGSLELKLYMLRDGKVVKEPIMFGWDIDHEQEFSDSADKEIRYDQEYKEWLSRRGN